MVTLRPWRRSGRRAREGPRPGPTRAGLRRLDHPLPPAGERRL